MSASATLPLTTAAPDADSLMTLEAAAVALACTPSAVRRWIAEGRLPGVKLGRLARVRRRDVLHVVTHGLPPRRA